MYGDIEAELQKYENAFGEVIQDPKQYELNMISGQLITASGKRT